MCSAGASVAAARSCTWAVCQVPGPSVVSVAPAQHHDDQQHHSQHTVGKPSFQEATVTGSKHRRNNPTGCSFCQHNDSKAPVLITAVWQSVLQLHRHDVPVTLKIIMYPSLHSLQPTLCVSQTGHQRHVSTAWCHHLRAHKLPLVTGSKLSRVTIKVDIALMNMMCKGHQDKLSHTFSVDATRVQGESWIASKIKHAGMCISNCRR